ncbi:arabinanase [Sesbania bispinosa]|nr:arabinanase [Sesbania bispinosa]
MHLTHYPISYDGGEDERDNENFILEYKDPSKPYLESRKQDCWTRGSVWTLDSGNKIM